MCQTVQTFMIHGSEDEVMAPGGKLGHYYCGKHQLIRLTSISSDEDIPFDVRLALLGLTICTIFTADQFREGTIPPGSRVAYASEVIQTLQEANREEAAETLQNICESPLDMCFFESDTFELVEADS